MTLWLTIGVSGVTCGGKTTMAESLYNFLSKPTNSNVLHKDIQIDQVKLINQDKYYLKENHPQHTLIEELNHINWEILSSLDMEQMCEDISNILGCNYRSYNIKKSSNDINPFLSQRHFNLSQNNCNNLNHEFTTEPPILLNILIIEGILIFNHHYTLDVCDLKFFLHLPYEKCYERRIKRSYIPPDVIGYFEMCVWPSYEKHFKEIKDRNDILKLNGDLSKEKLFNYIIKCIKESL